MKIPEEDLTLSYTVNKDVADGLLIGLIYD